MRVLYFAWLRERIGAGEEEVEPAGAATAGELVRTLVERDERYARAFEDLGSIRVAVDQQMGDLDTPIGGAREVAFFPPVTGG
jgi:molybdopterin synthase sulfur carrier subunit